MNNSFCPGCGSKIEMQESQFCVSCGYNFNGQNQVNNNQNQVNNNQSMDPNYGGNSNFTAYQGVKSYTNGMGIAGLVISIVSIIFCCGSLSLISLIFSIIGINLAKKNSGAGNGLSIAGLIVSIIGLLFMLVWLVPFIIGFVEGFASI